MTLELTEQQAVIDVLVRCAAAFDARDWPSLDDLFTEDINAYGAQGREAVVTTIRSFLGGCGPSQHLLGNYLFIVFAAVLAVGLMFLVAITIMVGLGNAAAMLG